MKNYYTFLYKNEVADIYDIDIRTLMSWINEYPALKTELETYGEIYLNKIFTLKQVEIIFKYLGSPENSEKNLEKIPVKSYSKNQIAKFYGISTKTLSKIIKSIPELEYLAENYNKTYNHNEVNELFLWLGTPYKVINKPAKKQKTLNF